MKVLGLYLEGDTVSFAVIQRKRKKILLHEVGSCSVKDSGFIKKNYQAGKIGGSLPASFLLIKQAQFPLTRRSILAKAISMQAETLSSMESKDFFYLTKEKISKEKVKVTYLFTKKTHIEQLLLTWKHAGFDPDTLSAAPQALIRFCKSLFSELKDAFILHLGKEETTLVLMKNHLLEDALSLDFSTQDLKDTPKGSKSSHPINDILSAISSFPSDKPLPLMITGYQNSFFSHALEQALDGKVAYVIPCKGKLAHWGRFAVAIGSALDTVSKDDHGVQFRKGIFHSSKSLQKFGRMILLFYMAAIGSGYLIYSELGKWKDQKVEWLTESCKRSIHTDNLLTKRKETIPLDQPLETLLSDWDIALQKENAPFRYPLSTPNVTEFLDWLSSIPSIAEKKISVESCKYHLDSYPTLQKPHKRYAATVELICKAETPEEGKTFIQFLSESKNRKNPVSGFTWDLEGNSYKFSFTLERNYELFRKDW